MGEEEEEGEMGRAGWYGSEEVGLEEEEAAEGPWREVGD